MDKLTSRSVYFTNYEKPGQEKVFDTITILDAALATTAATSFFDDKIITNDGITRTFGDAAIGENNPINGLWTEAIEQYGRDLEKKIRCLLSLGTGVPQLSQFGDDLKSVAESIIEIAKATEVTGDRFRNSNGLAGRGVYYRFSPPDIYTIRMDAAKMSGHIEALTAPYLETEETQGKIARFEQANRPEHSTSYSPR
jgi:calcium-independent phospholipase A2-gamma